MTKQVQTRLLQLLTYERAEFAKQDMLGTGRGWAKTKWIRDERLRLLDRSEKR
jgi:hypothetical protein